LQILLLLHLLLLCAEKNAETSMERSMIPTFPPPAETILLQEIDVMLMAEMPQLLDKSGRAIALPKSVYEALQCLVSMMMAGQSVAILSQSSYLSCQQASEILGCSRPHLYSLLDKGTLAYIKVGRHRRIQLADVLAYKIGRSSEQQKSLLDLATLIEKLGIN
jgi:excisionase family DNA binding protein